MLQHWFGRAATPLGIRCRRAIFRRCLPGSHRGVRTIGRVAGGSIWLLGRAGVVVNLEIERKTGVVRIYIGRRRMLIIGIVTVGIRACERKEECRGQVARRPALGNARSGLPD